MFVQDKGLGKAAKSGRTSGAGPVLELPGEGYMKSEGFTQKGKSLWISCSF